MIPKQELRSLAYPTIAEAVRGTRGVYLWDDRSYVTVGMRGLGRLGSYGNFFHTNPGNALIVQF